MLSDSKALASIATLLFINWLVLILSLRADYVNLAEVAPLGMVNLLFPYYWIVLLAFVVTCFFTFKNHDSPRWLHILLLAQLGLMLYYTPFLLGGFSWSPDSLWHAGVADYMPSILSGSHVTLGEYAQSYPLSYLVTYGFENLFSLNVFEYTLYIFPPVCIVLISTLAYFFASRIFDKRTAFLSLLLALPALHYIEPHVSPFATGTVLLLASLTLLTYKSAKALVFSALLGVLLVLTHPISPIFLGIYLASALIVTLLFREKAINAKTGTFLINPNRIKPKVSSKSVNVLYFSLLLVSLGAFWFYWTVYQAAPNYVGVQSPVANVFNLHFITNLFNTVQWTTSGGGFLYPWISQLSLLVYGLFLIGMLAVFMANFVGFIKNRRTAGSGSLPKLLTLTLMAVASGVMSYLLFSSSGERFLLGRGLIFFLLMASICIGSFLAEAVGKSRLKIAVAFLFVLFLVCTFPVVSYSKEAYNTFAPSSGLGLSFLSENINLSRGSLSMSYDQQLAAYVDLSKNLTLTGFPPDLSKQRPAVIVLRENAYYLLAMRYNFSLTNNSYTLLSENLTQNPLYDRAYSNAKFEVYVR